MAVFDMRNRVSYDYRFMNDGTPIYPRAMMTADGEKLFEFRDHAIPVYEINSNLQRKAQVGHYLSFTIKFECTNKTDPGKDLTLNVNLPSGFDLVKAHTDEGEYNETSGKWILRLNNDYEAYLDFIVDIIDDGTQTQTITHELSETELITTCVTSNTDPDGTIARHSPDLIEYPELAANLQNGKEYTVVMYHENTDSFMAGSYGDVEDGSTTGYTRVNNQTYTNLLDSDVALCTNAAKFHGNTGSETITVYTSFLYSEINLTSVIISCPGINNDEGGYFTVSGLTTGQTYTVAVCAYAESGVGLALYTPGPESYATFTPNGVVNEKRITFVATGTTQTIVTHLTTKAANFISLALNMVCHGTILHAPIVLPSETGNSVNIKNVSEVEGQMRVVYTGFNYRMTFTDANIEELVTKGATDVINLAYFNITDDYDNKAAHIAEYSTKFKEKGIKFHVGCAAFVHENGTQEDPTNSTYISTLVSTIENLFTDCPDLAGLSFDDFNYPSTYHLDANEATEETTLTNFIITVSTAIKAIRPTAQLSGALLPLPGVQGNDIEAFANEFDFSIWMGTYRFFRNVSRFITDRVTALKTLTGDNIVLPGVLTFYSDSDPTTYWPVSQLISDIYDILELNPQGYAIFDWLRHPEGLYCPVEKPKSGSHAIRIISYGETSGEGVKLGIPDIETNKLFKGTLNLKTVNGAPYKAGFGASVLESFTGNGDWKGESLVQTPSEKFVYVETSTAMGLVFYIDNFQFDNGVSGVHEGIKNNRISVINGKEYYGSCITSQNNIEKVMCSFIYDSSEELSIMRNDQYLIISTTYTNFWYGFCINEGFNKEYSDSMQLLSNPSGLFNDSGSSNLILDGNSESAEYIFTVDSIVAPSSLNSFFTGILLKLNSFLGSSGIKLWLVSGNGTISKIKTVYISKTGEILIGDMNDLWKLTNNDLIGESLEVHIIFTNTASIRQTFQYNNLYSILYWLDDITNNSRGVTIEGVHSKYYQLFMKSPNNPLSIKPNLTSLKVSKTDGTLITNMEMDSTTQEIEFVIEGDTIEDAYLKYRQIVKWMANERTQSKKPILKNLVYDAIPDLNYQYILSDQISVTENITALECKAQIIIPKGIGVSIDPIITGAIGTNPGNVEVYPLIVVRSDGSDQIVITENESGDSITLNSNVAENRLVYFDCSLMTVKDDLDNDLTLDVALNSVFPLVLNKDYNFNVTGGELQYVSYYPGY